MIYKSLPESKCALIRLVQLGEPVEADHANFGHRIRGVFFAQGEIHQYMETWRRTGLWVLYGYPDSAVDTFQGTIHMTQEELNSLRVTSPEKIAFS